MARPRVPVTRPACPRGHADGVIYLHGQRARRDRRYARPRYACVRDVDGAKRRHTWTLARRAPTATHPDGRLCANCEHEPVRGEGPSIAPAFAFAVAEAAHELVLVGEGTSIRESSQKVRFSAGKFSTGRRGRRDASREHSLGADYLDQFGPLVVRGMTPKHWPRLLVLDSLPLGIRVRDADLYGYQRFRRGGAVLVAAGRDRAETRTRCWLATLAGDESADSWYDALAQLDPEPAPFWVVADGSKAIRNAVEAIWPEAIFYPCEYHLRENALEHAKDDGALGEPGLEKAIEQGFYGLESWEHLGRIVQGLGPSLVWQWWLRTDPDAWRMVELKHRYGAYPNGNGPAERVAFAIKSRLGERTRVFRNADRLATVIALMGIDVAEQASDATYGRILREALERRGWRPELDWEGPHDYLGKTASLDELILAAWDRQTAAEGGDLRDSQTDSVERKAAAINVLRLATGGEPLEPVVGQGRSVASVSVAGKSLRDFPELMAEWDYELNGGIDDPGSIPAGRGVRPHWKCIKGHRWRAWLTDRTKRLTRCRRCHRQWADETTSIAAVHPELVPEWDSNENDGRSPERIKATGKSPAAWTCPAGLGHPAYSMSPLARGNKLIAGKPGCPICRQALTKAAARSPRRRGSALPG
jgi:hypothetical protein